MGVGGAKQQFRPAPCSRVVGNLQSLHDTCTCVCVCEIETFSIDSREYEVEPNASTERYLFLFLIFFSTRFPNPTVPVGQSGFFSSMRNPSWLRLQADKWKIEIFLAERRTTR